MFRKIKNFFYRQYNHTKSAFRQARRKLRSRKRDRIEIKTVIKNYEYVLFLSIDVIERFLSGDSKRDEANESLQQQIVNLQYWFKNDGALIEGSDDDIEYYSKLVEKMHIDIQTVVASITAALKSWGKAIFDRKGDYATKQILKDIIDGYDYKGRIPLYSDFTYMCKLSTEYVTRYFRKRQSQEDIYDERLVVQKTFTDLMHKVVDDHPLNDKVVSDPVVSDPVVTDQPPIVDEESSGEEIILGGGSRQHKRTRRNGYLFLPTVRSTFSRRANSCSLRNCRR